MKTNFSIVPKIFLRNPNSAFYVARTFFRKNKGARIDKSIYNGISKSLSLVYLRITPLCNLRCVMCGQRGDKGVLKGKFATDEAKKIVPLERYKKLVDELAPQKPVYYLWGGEPFMYPDFMELCRYMREKGMIVTVNTNGTYLKEHAEQIVRDKWAGLFVSLDGFEDVNDDIRGKGSYQRVIDGFKAINEEKKKQGSHLPYMGIVTTVNNKNYLYLDKLAEAAKDFGLAWHIINLGTYANEQIITSHTDVFQKKFGITPNCINGYNTGYNEGIDGQKFKKILERVHSFKNGYPIITVPAINPDKIGEYYSNLDKVVREKCPVPWSQANIDYNGNVHFCADYPDYTLGNIMEDSFNDIFNNEKARKFRQELKNSPHEIFPGCVRCYQNMLFGKKVKGY